MIQWDENAAWNILVLSLHRWSDTNSEGVTNDLSKRSCKPLNRAWIAPATRLGVKMDIGFAVLCGAGRGLAWPAALQIFMFLRRPCRFGKTAAAIGWNAAMAASWYWHWSYCRKSWGRKVIMGRWTALAKTAVGKSAVEKAAVEKAAGAEAEAGQIGLAIIRAALKSSFAENTLITSIMPR